MAKKTSNTLKIFHLVAAIQFSFALWYHNNVAIPPESVQKKLANYGGPYKYLTVLDCIIQAVYFTVCLINDFIGTNEVSPKKTPLCRKLKDFMLPAFAFPIALNVFVTFWTLMAIDRELVFPKAFDAFFPAWLNHVMHTNIVIFMVLEMCTSFRQYPKRKTGLTALSLFMAAYLVWLHIIKHFSGVWVYPVLEVLNLAQRIVFFAVILLFSLGLYMFGEFFNNIIWTKELKQIKAGSKKTK